MKVKGIAWGFDTPVRRNGYDIIVNPGAFKASIKSAQKAPLSMHWKHDDTQIPVGVITSMTETVRGLEFEGEIIDTQMGADLVAAMRSGAVRGSSVSFDLNQAKYQRDDKNHTMTFSHVPLIEISATNHPAHPAARMWLVEEPVTQPSPPAAGEQKE